MVQHAKHHGWGFPKGHIGDTVEGESKEATAIREVKEETGIDAEIIKKACEETYWYKWRDEKRKKTVTYFIMKYLGGDFSTRDNEMECVEWVKASEIEKKLTYKNAKKMYRKIQPEVLKVASSMA